MEPEASKSGVAASLLPPHFKMGSVNSVGKSVDSDVQGELLPIIRADAFAFITGVVGAECATKAVLTHHGHQAPLIKKAFKLDVAGLIQAADAVNGIKRTIDQMIVRNRPDLFVRKNSAELPPPGFWEVGICAAARSEKKSSMAEILPEVFDLRIREDKIIVPV